MSVLYSGSEKIEHSNNTPFRPHRFPKALNSVDKNKYNMAIKHINFKSGKIFSCS